MNWIPAILAIGVLIVVHEAGHYIVARLCSMRVERFSIGFGPAILKWKSPKTGTQFQLAPIPFGGFVEIKGMNILEEVDPNDASAYPNRPAWQRFVTIFAGPATNYLFAVVLAFGVFMFAGIRSGDPSTVVDSASRGDVVVVGLEDSRKWSGEAWAIGVADQPMAIHDAWVAPDGRTFTVGAMAGQGAALELAADAEVASFPQALHGVWGTASDDVLAVGDGGVIRRWDGTGWSTVPSGTTATLRDLHDGFAIGDGGTIVRRAGGTWTPETSGVSVTLHAVWSLGDDDAFAVGDAGTILRWNGEAWAAMTSGTTRALYGVWAAGADDAFAVGDAGTILRWDGKAWAPVASKTDHALHDVWGRNSGSVYAVGGAGTVLHFDGTAWTPLHAQAKGELRAVAGAGGYAAEGKLRPGDRFVAVDGKPIVGALGAAVKQVGDREAVFQVERVVDGQKTLVDVKLRPRYDEAAKAWRLGVILRGVGRVDVGVGTAAKEAVIYPAVQTKAILVGLYEWITGKVDGRMSSVVGIGQVVKQAIDESWVIALELLMVLNVYLGLFNLFPLPALDGGRLVFLTYEMVTRRRANPKLEATIHMAGVLVLAVLLVVVTVNDCRHL